MRSGGWPSGAKPPRRRRRRTAKGKLWTRTIGARKRVNTLDERLRRRRNGDGGDVRGDYVLEMRTTMMKRRRRTQERSTTAT